MKALFEEYGGPIIAAIVIVALIAIVTVLLASGGDVASFFNDTIGSLFDSVDLSSLPAAPVVPAP